MTSCGDITMDASLYAQQAVRIVPVYEKTPRLAEIIAPLHHSLRSEISFRLHFLIDIPLNFFVCFHLILSKKNKNNTFCFGFQNVM